MTQRQWFQRRLAQVAWDALSWIMAVPLALLFRYDFDVSGSRLLVALVSGVIAALIHIAAGSAFHLYQGRYVVGSFDEVLGLVVTCVFVGALGTFVLLIIPGSELPRSTFVIAVGIAAASMLGARFILRGARQQRLLSREGKKTLIFGAGDAGSQIVTLMLNDRDNEYQPVGFIDDNPRKHHLRRSGIKVLGTSSQIEEICSQTETEVLLIAIAGIQAAELLDLDQRMRPLGVSVTIIPTASEIVGGAVKLGDISDVTEEDLMGRRPINTDEAEITAFIRGKRVLVTGAGGSIGSELVRQISRYRPTALFLLDRDESALHRVQLTLDGTGHLMSPHLILADIRDAARIDEILTETQPEIVFHSAALKHLPLLERHPEEAFKTNVRGTASMLQASMDHGVTHFVNISTDKAADPTSILGKSKLLTEQLTAGVPEDAKRSFVSVRFGNVLGSRGSVIETFRFQIENGGPVTVTDEAVTRFFMTIREAVHLVLQAAVIGNHGETLILDMGLPLKIADLAQHMINRSGRNISVEFTGLRPGEKAHEVLVSSTEEPKKTSHELITSSRVSQLSLPGPSSIHETNWLEIQNYF
ncbi:MAG: nucleoside-diphosphate sugar epimerase/dehydratase [Candidatus Nanopelagicales bacterium]|nr:nucleoside-diphosphate sugar epimerase/dehydratase [Candidatus Nanopelagicales bacterium]